MCGNLDADTSNPLGKSQVAQKRAVFFIAAETRYRFEKQREGREVYGKAKTGIDYLPFKLSMLTFENAINHIENVHQQKHLADLYVRELPAVVKWPPEYKPYERIDSYRKALIRTANWGSLSRDRRLEILLAVVVDDDRSTALNPED